MLQNILLYEVNKVIDPQFEDPAKELIHTEMSSAAVKVSSDGPTMNSACLDRVEQKNSQVTPGCGRLVQTDPPPNKIFSSIG